METFLSEIASKRIAMEAQFYDVETIARILGPEAAVIWSNIDWVEADFRCGIRVCVRPGSARAVSDDVRAQRMMTAIQMASQNPIAQSMLNQQTLWTEFFRSIGMDMNSPLFNSPEMQQMELQKQQLAAGGGSAPGAPSTASSEAGMAQMGA
mgnify:CR=1 FL=1